MTPDLIALAATLILAFVQVGMASVATLRQAGPAWVLSPRDQPHEMAGLGGRLVRAHRNLLEILPQFIGAVFIVHAADSVSALAAWGAWIFFAARVLYIPAYLSAINGLRPICWQIAMFGLLAVLVDAFV